MTNYKDMTDEELRSQLGRIQNCVYHAQREKLTLEDAQEIGDYMYELASRLSPQEPQGAGELVKQMMRNVTALATASAWSGYLEGSKANQEDQEAQRSLKSFWDNEVNKDFALIESSLAGEAWVSVEWFPRSRSQDGLGWTLDIEWLKAFVKPLQEKASWEAAEEILLAAEKYLNTRPTPPESGDEGRGR